MIRTLIAVTALACTSITYGRMISISGMSDYKRHFSSNTPLITMYTGNNCGACKQMKPQFEAVAQATPDVNFCIINVDAKEFTSLTSSMRSIPVSVLSVNGKEIRREVGSLSKNQLNLLVKAIPANKAQSAPVCPKKP